MSEGYVIILVVGSVLTLYLGGKYIMYRIIRMVKKTEQQTYMQDEPLVNDAVALLKVLGFEMTNDGLELVGAFKSYLVNNPAEIAVTIAIQTLALEQREAGRSNDKREEVFFRGMATAEKLSEFKKERLISEESWRETASILEAIIKPVKSPGEEQERERIIDNILSEPILEDSRFATFLVF
ncbi:MAG: hypothetical protein AB2552_17565 [Candidatus Thiodiazotropha endolucinida]